MDFQSDSDRIPLMVGDRVAAIKDGKVRKARVVGITADIFVDVTFEKGGDVVTFSRDSVMMLYRYVDTPKGKGVAVAVGAPSKVL